MTVARRAQCFDAFPTVTLDISLRALGFWSFWLFIIPSLRARRPRGWEKLALNIAFLGSPIVTIGAPFLTSPCPRLDLHASPPHTHLVACA